MPRHCWSVLKHVCHRRTEHLAPDAALCRLAIPAEGRLPIVVAGDMAILRRLPIPHVQLHARACQLLCVTVGASWADTRTANPGIECRPWNAGAIGKNGCSPLYAGLVCHHLPSLPANNPPFAAGFLPLFFLRSKYSRSVNVKFQFTFATLWGQSRSYIIIASLMALLMYC